MRTIQTEVIDLASQGLKQSEIADWLDISPRQVYRLMESARAELGARTNQELIAKAIQVERQPPRAGRG